MSTAIELHKRLERCAESCEMYSPDQCATLIDGIGWLAMRHLLREAAQAIATPHPEPAATQDDTVLLRGLPTKLYRGTVSYLPWPDGGFVVSAAQHDAKVQWLHNDYRHQLSELRAALAADKGFPGTSQSPNAEGVTVARAALSSPPGVQAAQVSEAEVYRAARVLSDRSADACNIDRNDNWHIYSDVFAADARAMLEALAQPGSAAHGGEDAK